MTEEAWWPPRGATVSRHAYLAILQMLVRRATWRDRIVARFRKGHWLNLARHELSTNYVARDASGLGAALRRARP